MQKNGLLAYLTVLLLGAILALLGIFVFEINNVEERQIQLSGQLRTLGEGNDRLRGDMQRLQNVVQSRTVAMAPNNPSSPGATVSANPAPSAAQTAPAQTAPATMAASGQHKYLHPEVANYLQPHNFEMTVPEADMNGTIVRPYGGAQIKGFNILTENAADLGDLYSYVGDTLASRMVWTDPDKWYGTLAERMEITNNNQEMTIYLKPGIKWQSPGMLDLNDPKYAWLRGDHYLTAKDVKFSFDMITSPQVQNSSMKSYYEDVESYEAIDDYTFVVRWKKPYYNAIDTTLSTPIIPEFVYAFDERGERYPDETIGLNFNSHWFNSKGIVGTGPYRMISYKPGNELRLERFEDYYDVRPAIKSVVFLLYEDPNLTLLKMKAHELTMGGLRPSQYQEEIGKYREDSKQKPPANSLFWNGSILHKRIPQMVYYYIGWNADKPLFGDKMVRRAMTYAFNRRQILEKVYFNLGQIVTGSEYLLSEYYDKSVEPYPYDLAQAKEMLLQAGWKDTDGDGLLDKDLNLNDKNSRRQPFEFSLLIYAGSPEFESTASIFRDDLLKIGVKMNIQSAEWSLMQQKMEEKDFDAYTGGWGLGWDSDPYQLWHSSEAEKPKSSNRIGFRNKEADEIIEKLRRSFDKNERVKLFHRFHAILHEEQPYTFFYTREAVPCWWKETKRVVFSKVRPETQTLPWYVQTRP